MTTRPNQLPQLAAPERAGTLADQLYTELRRGVLAGAFVPGQRMTIRALAADMGVSPTPAREALNRLVAEGGLEYGPGKTVRAPILTGAAIEEVYLLRLQLEPKAVELGIAAHDSRATSRLDACIDRHEAALDRRDFRAALRENQGFHFALYAASGRPLLVQVIEAMWLRVGPMMHLLYPTFDLTRAGVRNHREAVAAIRAGDGAGLGQVIRQDLEEGRDAMLRAFAGGAGRPLDAAA